MAVVIVALVAVFAVVVGTVVAVGVDAILQKSEIEASLFNWQIEYYTDVQRVQVAL